MTLVLLWVSFVISFAFALSLFIGSPEACPISTSPITVFLVIPCLSLFSELIPIFDSLDELFPIETPIEAPFIVISSLFCKSCPVYLSTVNLEFPSFPTIPAVFSNVPICKSLPSPTINVLWLSTNTLFPLVRLPLTLTESIPLEPKPTLTPLLLPVVVLVFCFEITSIWLIFPVTFPPSWLKPFTIMFWVLLCTSFTFWKLPLW